MISSSQRRFCLVSILVVAGSVQVAFAQPESGKSNATKSDKNALVTLTGEQAVPDLIFRKSGGPAIGHLQSMLAFATVYDDEALLRQRLDVNKRAAERNSERGEDASQPNKIPKTTFTDGTKPGSTRVSRDDIRFILLDGKTMPAEPPEMPADKDSVLLDNGKVLTGMVMVPGEKLFVGGQSVPVADVTLIRLKTDEDESPIYSGKPPEDKKDEKEPPERGLGHWVGTIAYTSDRRTALNHYARALLRVSLSEEDLTPKEMGNTGVSTSLIHTTFFE